MELSICPSDTVPIFCNKPWEESVVATIDELILILYYFTAQKRKFSIKDFFSKCDNLLTITFTRTNTLFQGYVINQLIVYFYINMYPESKFLLSHLCCLRKSYMDHGKLKVKIRRRYCIFEIYFIFLQLEHNIWVWAKRFSDFNLLLKESNSLMHNVPKWSDTL